MNRTVISSSRTFISRLHTFYQRASFFHIDDTLSIGPLSKLTDRLFWSQTRICYWNDFYPKELTVESPKCLDIDEILRVGKASDEIVVWVGSTIGDILFLCGLITALHFGNVNLETVRIINPKIDPKSGHPLKHISILSQEGLQQCVAIEQRLTDADIANMLNVWDAVTSHDPSDIIRILKEIPDAPFGLKSCLSAYLNWYPSKKAGVSEVDLAILRYCATTGPSLSRVIAEVCSWQMHTVHDLGDLILFARAFQMASDSLANPLLRIEGNWNRLGYLRVKLTDFGALVLQEKKNAIQKNGIDEWIGGVHLFAPSNIWFREGQNSLIRYQPKDMA